MISVEIKILKALKFSGEKLRPYSNGYFYDLPAWRYRFVSILWVAFPTLRSSLIRAVMCLRLTVCCNSHLGAFAFETPLPRIGSGGLSRTNTALYVSHTAASRDLIAQERRQRPDHILRRAHSIRATIKVLYKRS